MSTTVVVVANLNLKTKQSTETKQMADKQTNKQTENTQKISNYKNKQN